MFDMVHEVDGSVEGGWLHGDTLWYLASLISLNLQEERGSWLRPSPLFTCWFFMLLLNICETNAHKS